MATVNLSVNVGENKRITFHSGGTYNPEDIVFDVSANGSGYKPLQTAVSDPTASSTTSTTFIDSISQNANGVITATKKTLPSYASSNHSHAFSSITSRGEAYLEWGGKNLSGTYAPIDAAMVGLLGANRTAFVSPNVVTVEYSRDGGTTWTDYGASNSDKTGFFTDFHNSGFYIGKSTASNPANANCQLRVTLSTSSSVYTVLNKFVIYVSTNGSSGTWCSIDARLQSNVTNNTNNWVNFANKIGISGWSGYNVINIPGIVTYGNTASSQYGQVRFTFGCTSSSTSYPGLLVYGVNCYGGVGWTTPSTMARSGELYTFDMSQNAIFPANITATKFVKRDGTSSQFLKADGSVDSNSYSTTSHTHATSIAASSGTNQITLAFGTKYAITAGGTSYVFTMPSNPNTNTTYTITTGDEKGQIKVTPSSGNAYNVNVNGLGSAAYTQSSAYATASHTHDYLPLAGGEVTGKIIRRYSSTSNDATIHVLSKNTDNYIWKVDDNDTPGYGFGLKYIGSGTGNNNDLVLFADNQAQTQKEAFRVHQDGVVIFGTTPLVGSTAVSLSNHTHATTIAASSGTNQLTLAFGSKYAITAGGTSYVFTMPSNPNTNTTYTFATGDANGQIKVTPSGGSAQNVSVKGLGSAAYTESSAYATSGHTHTTTIAESSATSQLTLAFGKKYHIEAGGNKYVFTMPSNPNTNTTYTFATGDEKGQIKVTPSSGSAYNVKVNGLGSAAYTESGDYAISGHTHTTSIAASTGTNQLTLAFGGKYAITAGGTSYVFTMPANPDTDVKVKQTAHTTTDATEYPIITTTTASPTSGTAYEAKYATQAAVTGSGDIVLKKSSSKCRLKFDNSLNCLDFIFE